MNNNIINNIPKTKKFPKWGWYALGFIVFVCILMVIFSGGRTTTTEETRRNRTSEETRRNRTSESETITIKESETKKEVKEEIEEIKERLKNMETYSMKEYYVSKDGNNGLTVGGTIVEQMIDVAIEIFKQPLVKEFSTKVISNKEDALQLSKYIERVGKVVVDSVKSNPVLRCAAPVVTECEGEGEEQKCKSYTDPEYEVGDEDCKLYRPNNAGINNIKKSVLLGIRSIFDGPTEKDKLYTLFKSLATDNIKFLASMNNKSEAEVEKLILGIPEKDAWTAAVKAGLDNSVSIKSDQELRKDEPIPDETKFE